MQARMDMLVDELEGIRGDVEQSEAALDTAEVRARTLEAEVEAAEAEVAALRAEIDVTRAAIVGSAANKVLKRLQRRQRLQVRSLSRRVAVALGGGGLGGTSHHALRTEPSCERVLPEASGWHHVECVVLAHPCGYRHAEAHHITCIVSPKAHVRGAGICRGLLSPCALADWLLTACGRLPTAAYGPDARWSRGSRGGGACVRGNSASVAHAQRTRRGSIRWGPRLRAAALLLGNAPEAWPQGPLCSPGAYTPPSHVAH